MVAFSKKIEYNIITSFEDSIFTQERRHQI